MSLASRTSARSVDAIRKARRRAWRKFCHMYVWQITALTLQLIHLLLVASIMSVTTSLHQRKPGVGSRLGCGTMKRHRKSYVELLAEFGPNKFRRMYRMHEHTFLTLFHLLDPFMKCAKIRKRGATPNGAITKENRLLMALRFFAGGCKHDIGIVHGVSENEVYRSVWRVVDAVHQQHHLNITFPQTHHEQANVAAGFQFKSDAGFSNCVGCIDGMLIWTSKPSEKTEDLGVGPSKFFCQRKGKWGSQLQGVCDVDRRFLDVHIHQPGSGSDFTMWMECKLRENVETVGFLLPGLVLFGDNAYVNTPYMVSPFKAVSSGPKDDFNFYQS